MNTVPSTSAALPAVLPATTLRAISLMSSVPVAPYSIDMPYSRKPEASAPSTKYFIAASVARASSRRSATSAYIASACSSRPR